MNPPATNPSSGGSAAVPFSSLRGLLSPRVVLGLLVLAGCSGFALSPELRHKLGMAESRTWFLDTYALLASSDAARAGLDPYQPNPLDVFNRPHSYSRWWFALGDLGLTREDNFLLGGVCVLLFFAAVFALLRPQTYEAAAWYALLILSPPVQLAVLRANNDLVIFAVLTAGLLACGVAVWRLGLFAAAVMLATGLKFYPIVAGSVTLLVRPPRRMLVAGVFTLLATLLILASVWHDWQRAVILSAGGLYTMGAQILFRDLGWTGPVASGVAGIILLTLAAIGWRRGWTTGVGTGTADLLERHAFVCGASVLVACFLADISFSYHMVFTLMVAPWLWRQGWAAEAAGRTRFVARLTAGLLLVALWHDGALCLLVNGLIGPLTAAQVDRIKLVWRLATEPVIWAGMILLAAGLLEVLGAAWADWRRESRLMPAR